MDEQFTYIPKYVKQVTDYNYGETITHEAYNQLMNLNSLQGDYNSEVLDTLLNESDSTQTYHVPYIDTELENLEANKVDKVPGKELSTNDYTTEEKNKLADLENYDDTELRSAINNKVDKVAGKQLSTNDYTTAEKTKLAGLHNYDDTAIRNSLNNKVDKVNGKGLSTNDYTTTEKNKLAGIASGAEVNVQSNWNQTNNAADDYIKNKPTLGTAASKNVGSANGVAELDSSGKVPSSQLPSYVDDVVEYATRNSFPATGESGKIYIAIDTNTSYRWSGSTYVALASGLTLGETASTAYRGDRGKAAYDHSLVTSGNPHNVTASDVGLSNVGNFKAVSTVASQGLTTTEQANARANINAISLTDIPVPSNSDIDDIIGGL